MRFYKNIEMLLLEFYVACIIIVFMQLYNVFISLDIFYKSLVNLLLLIFFISIIEIMKFNKKIESIKTKKGE